MKNNIKNSSWIWIVIGLLILGISYFIITNHFHGKNTVPQICNEQICFTVELARTVAEREQGLMNRQAMSENHGMLFIFTTPDFHNFRMKNTLLPLDMLWLDDEFKVVRIMTAQPCTADPCIVYKPEVFSNYVVEINAGMAEKYGIKEGTIVKFRNIQ